jgi:hypothetical protein
MIEDISSRTLGIVDKHDIMGMILLNELGSYLTTTSLSSIRCGFAPGFVNYKKGCTRLVEISKRCLKKLQVKNTAKRHLHNLKKKKSVSSTVLWWNWYVVKCQLPLCWT